MTRVGQCDTSCIRTVAGTCRAEWDGRRQLYGRAANGSEVSKLCTECQVTEDPRPFYSRSVIFNTFGSAGHQSTSREHQELDMCTYSAELSDLSSTIFLNLQYTNEKDVRQNTTHKASRAWHTLFRLT